MAERSARRVAAHREVPGERRPGTNASIILCGWTYRARVFRDGRRQLLGLLLPGELIGGCRHRNPVTATDVMALTEVMLCTAPRRAPEHTALAEAYARSSALEEFFLFRQIARLSAYERLIDQSPELLDRLSP